MGESDAGAVLRPRRTRRGARRRRQGHVRRVVRRNVLRHGAGRSGEGFCVNDRALSQQLATTSFFDRARARLTLDVPPALNDPSAAGARGDLDLNPDVWRRAGVKATKPAAVLVPVIDRAEPTVLLTLRTAELTSHAGQVAFPGGKIDPTDESPVAAALREAKEETGLAPNL